MLTEEDVRRIVRDEIENEMLRGGGVLDHCREVTINALKQIGADQFLTRFHEANRSGAN